MGEKTLKRLFRWESFFFSFVRFFLGFCSISSCPVARTITAPNHEPQQLGPRHFCRAVASILPAVASSIPSSIPLVSTMFFFFASTLFHSENLF